MTGYVMLSRCRERAAARLGHADYWLPAVGDSSGRKKRWGWSQFGGLTPVIASHHHQESQRPVRDSAGLRCRNPRLSFTDNWNGFSIAGANAGRRRTNHQRRIAISDYAAWAKGPLHERYASSGLAALQSDFRRNVVRSDRHRRIYATPRGLRSGR